MHFCLLGYFLLLIIVFETVYCERGDKSVKGRAELNTTISSVPKAVEKVLYPKKVSSLKKRPIKLSAILTTGKSKKNQDATSAFTGLPEDDFEFIKELDKQFKLHGNRIKIKVERENSTTSKNSKRTIEGELGSYGQQHNGYEYARPKYEFYPYSQHDIPSNAPGYYPPEPSISIQPSYSYELQPQTYLQEEQPQLDLPHSTGAKDYPVDSPPQQRYSEPVIILHIPGPPKYVSHLQTLLQQYLEIRAAQYLSILQEAELHNQQEARVVKPQIEQPQDAPPVFEQPPVAFEHSEHTAQNADLDYNQEVAYAHQTSHTPAPIQYPDIDQVYHRYLPVATRKLQQHQPTYSEEVESPHSQHQQEVPQYIHVQNGPEHIHQPLYTIDMAPQGAYSDSTAYKPTYVPEEEIQSLPQDQHANSHVSQDHVNEPAIISENSPRKTHTRVVFPPYAMHDTAEYMPLYKLPPIRPYEHHSSAFTGNINNQKYQEPNEPNEHSPYENTNYSPAPLIAEGSQKDTVTITQKPYNYHAHDGRVQTQVKRGHKRNVMPSRKAKNSNTSSSAVSADSSEQKTEQKLKKIRDFVRDNLGAQMSTAVEYKTTQVVKAIP